MIRTFKQQQEHEHKERTKWLQRLADSGMTQTQASKRVGIDRSVLARMCSQRGVTGFVLGNCKSVCEKTLSKTELIIAQKRRAAAKVTPEIAGIVRTLMTRDKLTPKEIAMMVQIPLSRIEQIAKETT